MHAQRGARIATAVHHLHELLGHSGVTARGHERLTTRGCVLGWLDHDAVAGEERGEHLPGGDRHGEVPRCDHSDNADGMARRERDLVRHLARDRLAPRGAILPRHERRHVDCFLHVARGFDEHLAGFAADERRELALARRE